MPEVVTKPAGSEAKTGACAPDQCSTIYPRVTPKMSRWPHFDLLSSLGLGKQSVTSHFSVTSEKKSHLYKELSSATDTGVVLTKRPYLSLRIFQYNLHIFTSAPGVLVLPDEVSGRTGCDTSICSPDLEKRKDISPPRIQPFHILVMAT